MRKIIPLLLLLGMCFSTSVKAFDLDSCSVTVWQDSLFLPDSIVLHADGLGTPPFTYEWSTGDTSNPIIVWDTTEYCVTITDADGCVASGCINAYYNDPNCWSAIHSVNNGAGLVYEAFTGGTPPFQYFWSTGETSQTIVPDSAGDYCLYVIDAVGCVTPTNCVYYSGGSPDSCWTQMQSVSLGNNGVGLWATSSGSWPYVYAWSNGSTESYIEAFTSGTYCVSVVDAAGCVAVDCYEHLINNTDSCAISFNAYQDSVGILIEAVATGTGPFTYLWNPFGFTTPGIYVTDAGNYCVTIEDANGCIANACYYYAGNTNPDSCYATISALPSQNIGEDLCAYSTGPGPYTYLWSTGQTSFLINVVAAGNYCVTVVDANGCEASTCYFFPGVSTNDSCSVAFTSYQDSLGILIEAVPTGTAPFTYLWNVFGFTTPGIYVVDAGEYCVMIEDANGCIATDCFYYAGNTNPDSCYATITGFPSQTAGVDLCAYSSGPGPYTYLWSTGETVWLINVLDPGEYCVTVVDGNGCEASTCYNYLGSNPNCTAYIAGDSLGLTNGIIWAGGNNGTPPYTYLWSTGETTQNIQVVNEGIHCVTITDSDSCQADYCTYAYPPMFGDSCSVEIFYIDSLLSNGLYLYANAFGVGPFNYEWSTGDTLSYLEVTVAGNYCVTVTNALGCVATTCFDYVPGDFCSVYIYQDSVVNEVLLIAQTNATGPTPFTYEWSTGETTQEITPSLGNGTYCVTLTNGDGCTAVSCFYYYSAGLHTICGLVHLPDSSLLMGSTTVALYRLENGGTTFVEDQYLAGESNLWYYNFTGMPAGDYIVKATIDAGATAGSDYVPTYHHNAVLWDDATVISIGTPQQTNWCNQNIMMVPDGNVAGTGNGGIAGNVHDLYESLEGITILLYDEFGNLIDHLATDANGEYLFKDLPLGRYRIVIEYTGFNHAEYWITLTEETPRVVGLNFEVDSGVITTGTFELASSSSLKVFPNPISDQMSIQLDQSWNQEVNVRILNLEGKVIAQLNQELNNDVLVISAIDWESGMYFFQINDGRQMASGKVVKH